MCDAKRNGCSRRNVTAAVVEGEGEGSLKDMFARTLLDFPQYEPTALSLDPPIIQFENLLTAAEAEDMIDRCRAFGKFERSQAGRQVAKRRLWSGAAHRRVPAQSQPAAVQSRAC